MKTSNLLICFFLCSITLGWPVDARGVDTIANWLNDDSARALVKTTLPKGAELRIRVVKKGTFGDLKSYTDRGPLAHFQFSEITPNQVFKKKLTESTSFLALWIIEKTGPKPFDFRIAEIKSITPEKGGHTMVVEGGWVLELKVVPDEF